MGIGEGSFYNTLKSKKHAYLECLKHYNETVNRKRARSLPDRANSRPGHTRALPDGARLPRRSRHPLARLPNGRKPHPRGSRGSPELRHYVEDRMSHLAAAITARMQADQQSGLLAREVDPQLVAPVVITYMQGIWRMALVSYDRPRFERQIDVFLTGLGL